MSIGFKKSSAVVEMSDRLATSTIDIGRKLGHVPFLGELSPGPDGLHPMILNRCADAIAEPLTWIFQKSFNTCIDWRTADISPIFGRL